MFRPAALTLALAAPAAEAAPVLLTAEGVVSEVGPSFDPSLFGLPGALLLFYDDAAGVDADPDPAVGLFELPDLATGLEVDGAVLDVFLGGTVAVASAEFEPGEFFSALTASVPIPSEAGLEAEPFGELFLQYVGFGPLDPGSLPGVGDLAGVAGEGFFALRVNEGAEELRFSLTAIDIAPIPLPATGLALLAGLGALGAYSRARRT